MTKAFIIGHPVKHSRSPLIHGYWLQQHGIAGTYERVDVAPAELADFLRDFSGQGFVGGNVTIPHKEQVFARADEASERAKRLGAVNTLWLQDGRLHGDNTDVTGFVAHLDQELGAGWPQRHDTALILGAGGAARAVAAGLLDRGLGIVVANRSLDRAEALSALDPTRIRAVPWERIPDVLPRTGLLVNTTSLGMAGQPPLAIDLDPLPQSAAVADIVYAPLETALLAAARQRGLATVDGLGMLLHQAVPGFMRWFGVTPSVTPELRALIVADLTRPA